MLRRLSLSRLSLTRRLTLFFTLVAASIVLGLGGLFMTAADRHFIDLDRSVLQDKQHLIDDILTSANSAETCVGGSPKRSIIITGCSFG
jgi:two-component system heavy metal sensor histidine kinase CusS